MSNLAFKIEPDFTDEALSLGRGNLLESIKEDYTTLGLIGEDHNKLMCYLAAISRKMDNPLNILVLSSSGAGKSTLQDKTIKLTPPEDVIRTSSISNKALFYMDSLKGKLLALEEAAGITDTYAIRTLISEGHLTLEPEAFGRACSPQRAVSRGFVLRHKIADGYGEPSLPVRIYFHESILEPEAFLFVEFWYNNNLEKSKYIGSECVERGRILCFCQKSALEYAI